jgi:hypothetical protein
MKRTRAEQEALKILYPNPGDKREELYLNAKPALQKKLAWIQGWWERHYRHDVLSLYDLGRECKEVYDDVQHRGGRRYGSGAVTVIKEYFQLDDGLIYRGLRLANTYFEEEIKEATAHPKADGEPVSTHDLLILARVKDPALRKNLLDQAVGQGWRSWDLDEAVTKAVGKEEVEKADDRGRPLAQPRSFDDVIRQQERVAKDFVNRTVNVWEKPGSSLEGMAVVMAADDYTEERAEMLKSHAELLDRLAQEARERAEEARQVYERFVEILAGRLKASGEEEEEEVPPPPLGPTLPIVLPPGKRGRRKQKADGSDSGAGS